MQHDPLSHRPVPCHMCGLPPWACSGPGFVIKITLKAASRFHKDRHVSVWCCCRSCSIQTQAVAEMGPATHKWPMRLAEYAKSLEIAEAGPDRTETIAEKAANTGAAEAKNLLMDQDHVPEASVRKRRGGRPRRWRSEACSQTFGRKFGGRAGCISCKGFFPEKI